MRTPAMDNRAFVPPLSGDFEVSKARMPKRKTPRVSTRKTAPPPVARKRRGPGSGVAAPALPWLRSPSGTYQFHLEGERAQTWTRELQHAAMQWTYIIRNRQRWRGLPVPDD